MTSASIKENWFKDVAPRSLVARTGASIVLAAGVSNTRPMSCVCMALQVAFGNILAFKANMLPAELFFQIATRGKSFFLVHNVVLK